MERHSNDTVIILVHSLLQLFFKSMIVLLFYCSVLACILEHDVTTFRSSNILPTQKSTQYYSIKVTQKILLPPVTDTKLMGTAPTESNTDYSFLLAQQNTQMQAMQATVEKLIEKLSEKLLSGGGGDLRRNPNKNTSDPSNKRVVTFWWQWNTYCHSCWIILNGKSGCGTSGGKECYLKKKGHKDAAMFTNKMGGNTKRNHLWHLWCEPVTNRKVSVLPAGAKRENWWCGRELGKDKNTDNTNNELLKLNPSLSCNPFTSQLATLLYVDVIWKHSELNDIKPATLATLSYENVMRKQYQNDIKSATTCLIHSKTKNEKIKNITVCHQEKAKKSARRQLYQNFDDFITVRH